MPNERWEEETVRKLKEDRKEIERGHRREFALFFTLFILWILTLVLLQFSGKSPW